MNIKKSDPSLTFCRCCGAIQFDKAVRQAIRADYEHGSPMSALARKYRCNETTIRKLLREEKAFVRRSGAQSKRLTREQKTQVAERIFRKTLTKHQAMKELGIGWKGLRAILVEQGVIDDE